jgi:hypothetical protein
MPWKRHGGMICRPFNPTNHLQCINTNVECGDEYGTDKDIIWLNKPSQFHLSLEKFSAAVAKVHLPYACAWYPALTIKDDQIDWYTN